MHEVQPGPTGTSAVAANMTTITNTVASHIQHADGQPSFPLDPNQTAQTQQQQQQQWIAQIPINTFMEMSWGQKLEEFKNSLGPSIKTMVQDSLAAFQPKPVQQLPVHPLLALSSSTQHVARPHRPEDPLGGNRSLPHTGAHTISSKSKRKNIHPPSPLLPLHPPKRVAVTQDDTISLYASSQENSQSEGEDNLTPYSADSEEGDVGLSDVDSRPRLKSVVVVPEQLDEMETLNPVLQAALSAAIPIETTSPPIGEVLAQRLLGLWLVPLDQSTLDAIMEGINPPENAKFLRVQRTNEEVFSQVKQPIQAQDHSVQRQQAYVCKGAVQTVHTLHKMNDVPVDTPLTQTLKDELVTGLANIYMLLSHLNTTMSQNRKNKLARGVPAQFSGIRKADPAPSSLYLFGDEPHTVLSNAKKHYMAYNNKQTPSSSKSKNFQPRSKNGDRGKNSRNFRKSFQKNFPKKKGKGKKPHKKEEGEKAPESA